MKKINMTKKELLKAIEQKEFARLQALSRYRLVGEFQEWFQEDIKKGEDNLSIIDSLLEDFMRYREDESVEELTTYLKSYDKSTT